MAYHHARIAWDISYFHHENWGRWTHFDEIILQMSWFNHQVEDICVSSWNIVSPKAQRNKNLG